MTQRLRLFVRYYLFWIVFFILQKPLFLLLPTTTSEQVTAWEIMQVVWHGLPLDCSVAAYLTLLFGLLMLASFWLPGRVTRMVSHGYTAVLLPVALLIVLGDLGTFPSWGFRLDKTIFLYLRTPKEALACAPWYVWCLGVVALLLAFALCFMVYRRCFDRSLSGLSAQPMTIGRRIGGSLLMLLLTALLFLPIRGSVSVSTMNTGRVYFSSRQILNQAAINPAFNIIESLSENTFNAEKYTYMSADEAARLTAPLLGQTDSCTVQLSQGTNVILFILESFSANAIGALGGEPEVTPCFNRLAEQGLLFTRAYASSFRTDRGVVATLSAFPGQPTSSVMVVPHKASQLPQLTSSLLAEGYTPKFYYGGDEDFTMMRSYLIAGGMTERVSDKSFPIEQRLSKWGVHDHLLFERALQEIPSRPRPFADVVLSLSSHEPFEVPFTRHFDHEYLNAVAYTDSCLGAFMDSLRRLPVWDSTLVVMVADHGYPYPWDLANHEPARYHVPILMTGGALRQSGRVTTLCSQVDVVPTILAMLGIDHSAYRFGKDVLSASVMPYAFYSFNDGFALMTDSGTTVMDAKADCVILQDGHHDNSLPAKAYVQQIYEAIEQL